MCKYKVPLNPFSYNIVFLKTHPRNNAADSKFKQKNIRC